jgi:hypothetical protein
MIITPRKSVKFILLSMVLSLVLVACFRATPPHEQDPKITPQSVVSVTPVNGGELALGSSISVTFNAAMNQSSVQEAISLFSGIYDPSKNPTSFAPLSLTFICNGVWKATNPNSVPVSFAWKTSNGAEKGLGVVLANASVKFYSVTNGNKVQLFVNEILQPQKQSLQEPCNRVKGTFIWSNNSKTVKFKPTDTLVDGKTYTIVVSTAAKSSNNQPNLTTPFSSNFHVEDMNKYIDASIQGQERDIMRAVLASLLPQQRANVIFRAPDGATYTNRERLKGTIVPINTHGMINIQSDAGGQSTSVVSTSTSLPQFTPSFNLSPQQIEPQQVIGDDVGGYPQPIDHILQEAGGPAGQCRVDNGGEEGAGGAFWMGATKAGQDIPGLGAIRYLSADVYLPHLDPNVFEKDNSCDPAETTPNEEVPMFFGGFFGSVPNQAYNGITYGYRYEAGLQWECEPANSHGISDAYAMIFNAEGIGDDGKGFFRFKPDQTVRVEYFILDAVDEYKEIYPIDATANNNGYSNLMVMAVTGETTGGVTETGTIVLGNVASYDPLTDVEHAAKGDTVNPPGGPSDFIATFHVAIAQDPESFDTSNAQWTGVQVGNLKVAACKGCQLFDWNPLDSTNSVNWNYRQGVGPTCQRPVGDQVKVMHPNGGTNLPVQIDFNLDTKTTMDLDDGTLDGNQLLIIGSESTSSDGNNDGLVDNPPVTEMLELSNIDFLGEDADVNGKLGDGAIDIADFRRLRDWVLLATGQGENIVGSSGHPKKQVSAESIALTNADYDQSGNLTTEDFNSFYTTLTQTPSLWTDTEYQLSNLPNLLNSGDLDVWPQRCGVLTNIYKLSLEIVGVTSPILLVNREGLPRGSNPYNPFPDNPVDIASLRHLYTLPAGSYIIKTDVEIIEGVGGGGGGTDPISTKRTAVTQTVTLRAGEDVFLNPPCADVDSYVLATEIYEEDQHILEARKEKGQPASQALYHGDFYVNVEGMGIESVTSEIVGNVSTQAHQSDPNFWVAEADMALSPGVYTIHSIVTYQDHEGTESIVYTVDRQFEVIDASDFDCVINSFLSNGLTRHDDEFVFQVISNGSYSRIMYLTNCNETKGQWQFVDTSSDWYQISFLSYGDVPANANLNGLLTDETSYHISFSCPTGFRDIIQKTFEVVNDTLGMSRQFTILFDCRHNGSLLPIPYSLYETARNSINVLPSTIIVDELALRWSQNNCERNITPVKTNPQGQQIYGLYDTVEENFFRQAVFPPSATLLESFELERNLVDMWLTFAEECIAQ